MKSTWSCIFMLIITTYLPTYSYYILCLWHIWFHNTDTVNSKYLHYIHIMQFSFCCKMYINIFSAVVNDACLASGMGGAGVEWQDTQKYYLYLPTLPCYDALAPSATYQVSVYLDKRSMSATYFVAVIGVDVTDLDKCLAGVGGRSFYLDNT